MEHTINYYFLALLLIPTTETNNSTTFFSRSIISYFFPFTFLLYIPADATTILTIFLITKAYSVVFAVLQPLVY